MKASSNHALVGVVFLLVGLPLQAEGACTNPNSILNATYGWQIEEGLIAEGNTPQPKAEGFFPIATAGHFTFDGSGNLSGAHGTDFGGAFFRFRDSGTYSVNSDCITGSIVIEGGLRMDMVITDGGQEIKLTSATSGRVFASTLRTMAAPTCSASTLSGKSYGYATHGLVGTGIVGSAFPRTGGFLPFSDAGRISFEADGSVSGVDNVNIGGVFTAGLPIAGTYTVNSDCTGTTTMTIGGDDRSWSFDILQEADQIIFVTIPTSFVWAGTLTKE